MNLHPPTTSPRLAAGSLAAVGLVFGVCYWLSNRLTHARADIGTAVFDWEQAIPFVDWTIVPYLSIVPFFVASFFVPQSRDTLRLHAARLLALLAIALACYAVFPLRFTFVRPETSGFVGALFDLLNAVDQPYNRAPSLHIGVLVVLWVRYSRALTGASRLLVQSWFVLIGVSVLTTYQHHVVDVPAGALAGWASVMLFTRRSPLAVEFQYVRRRPRAARYTHITAIAPRGVVGVGNVHGSRSTGRLG